MKISIPYLKWRDGRPRWEPGPKLRDKGHKGRDLKNADGAWMNEADAVAAARAINQSVAEAVPAKRRSVRLQSGIPTLRVVWMSMERTPEYRTNHKTGRPKSPATLRDYANKANVFLEWAGDMPISTLNRKLIKDFWRALFETRGHAMANGVIAVLRLTLEYAVTEHEHVFPANPAKALKLPTVAPRVVTHSPSELALQVTVADAIGEHGIADAVYLAVATGQRQGDILSMPKSMLAGGKIRALRQNKTGAIVTFPQTKALRKRLTRIYERHSRYQLLARAERRNDVEFTHVVIDDVSRAPFDEHAFRHRYAAVLRIASDCIRIAGGKHPETTNVTDVPLALRSKAQRLLSGKEWDKDLQDAIAAVLQATEGDCEQAAASLNAKQFLDLRDTALTRLYLSGATVLRIAAISGHDPETVHKTLKHYIALTEDDGQAAITGMDTYMRDKGISV